MASEFESGAFRWLPAWHNEGVVWPTGERTVTQAMKMGGIYDHEILKEPLYTYAELLIPGQYALIRQPCGYDPNPYFLKVVSKKYQVIQNKDLAEILDPLSEKWPVESVGVLKRGAITYVTLRMDPYDVGGNPNETHNAFLFVGDQRHIAKACLWGITHVRVVCANTFQAAKTKLDMKEARISHTGDPQHELRLRRDLALYAIKVRERNIEELNHLFTKAISLGNARKMFESAFPNPPVPPSVRKVNQISPTAPLTVDIVKLKEQAEKDQITWDSLMRNTVAHRQSAEGRFEVFNQQTVGQKGYSDKPTAYGAFNAVTEEVNHGQMYNGDLDKQAIAILFGLRNKSMQKAYNTALKIKSDA